MKTEANPEAVRAMAAFYGAPGQVLLLDPMCQPVASEMQRVIQFQKAQLEQAGAAIKHCLVRIGSVDQVAHHLGACTETFERLTAAFAEIADLPVDQVREDVIPGSAAMHRPRREAA